MLEWWSRGVDRVLQHSTTPALQIQSLMALDQKLLEILACPETKEPVSEAGDELIATLNEAIETGTLLNRAGEKVTETIDGGLVRQDGKYLYPIRDDIPIMLIDEGIPLETV